MSGTNGQQQSRGGKAAARNTPARKPSAAKIAALEAATATGRPAAEQDAALAALRREAEEKAVGEVQAAAAGLDPANSVEFMGKRFRIAGKVGLMPLMKFAAVADAQIDTTDMRGLSAIYAMLRDCIAAETPPCGRCEPCQDMTAQILASRPDLAEGGIDLAALGLAVPDCPVYDPGDWPRFEQHAIETKADADDMLPVVQQTIEVLARRPTQKPSGSSSP